MSNLPGAKGRAVSSAGTPSRALQPLEQLRQEGAWEPALPGPGTAPSRRCLQGALQTPQPSGCRHRSGLAPSCPGCPAAPWSRLGYSSGAVGGRV